VKRVAIVGGGASGLLCAIICARGSLDVTVFEQNNKCAKKILVSGNGRCNITNTNLTSEKFFSSNPEFAMGLIRRFGFREFEKFCSSIGLVLDVKADGRVYPQSNEAKSVASLLLHTAEALDVTIKTDQRIEEIKTLFEEYDAVVIATGSDAASHLGGNGSGYDFAKEFVHTIIPPYPSLVQLHLTSQLAPKMSGAKIDAEVTLFINRQKELSSLGDILFTNYGISGFAILDISQRASQALQYGEPVLISLNLLPHYNPQKLASHISSLCKNAPALSVLDMLIGLLPSKIAKHFLEYIELDTDLKLTDLHTKQIKKIAATLLAWKFEVSDTHGFRHAEVSGGGIDTTEVDPHSCESLKQKNLYFCGEVLDVVGARGGYNFAFAWASGYQVAQSIITKALQA